MGFSFVEPRGKNGMTILTREKSGGGPTTSIRNVANLGYTLLFGR